MRLSLRNKTAVVAPRRRHFPSLHNCSNLARPPVDWDRPRAHAQQGGCRNLQIYGEQCDRA
eukprot:12919712-Prorocentrum_lima.AAC.1